MKIIFHKWGEWASNQFPNQPILGKANHLKSEVKELIANIEEGNIDILEIADCFGLLFSICKNENISYDILKETINSKLLINKERDWSNTPNKDGSYTHIESKYAPSTNKFVHVNDSEFSPIIGVKIIKD